MYSDGSVGDCGKGRPRTGTKLLNNITFDQFKEEFEKNPRKTRLCGDLTTLIYHESKVVKTRERICAFCSHPCSSRCLACPDTPYLHHNVRKGQYKYSKCFYHYHSNAAFGLAKNDVTKYLGSKKMDWMYPKEEKYRPTGS